MNSPLTTSVVGTSIPELRPNAPLTPAMVMTIARPPTIATMVRFLSRHMPLHRDSGFQAGRNNYFVIVHGTERDGARSRAAAVEHPHRERIVLTSNSVARHDDDVVLP